MKTNPNIHIICGKCGCATMMTYSIKIEEDKPQVYLICENCETLTNINEVLKTS
jgi:hypothetical protein